MYLARLLPILFVSVGLPSLQAAPPRTDARGDPLPPGAVARIGTVRSRHGGSVSSVAFSSDGKRITSTDGRTVGVWDAHTGRTIAFRFLPQQWGIWSPVVSPDGTLIACRLQSGVLGVQETESGKQRCALPCKGDGICDLAFSNDNRWLVSTDTGKNIRLWDLARAKLSQQWKSPARASDVASGHTFTPDGKGIVHWTSFGHIHTWDVQSGKELGYLGPEENRRFFFGLAITPDGKALATRDGRGRLRLWQRTTGRLLREIAEQPCECGPALSRDGKHVACGNDHGEIHVWDVATGKLVRRLRGAPEGYAASLAFSPDGKMLVSGGQDHAVHLWDLATGKERFPAARLSGDVSARFLSDGKTLLSHCRYRSIPFLGTVDPRLGFWDLKGQLLRQASFRPLLSRDSSVTYELAVSPDGKTLALADGFPFPRFQRVPKNSELWTTLRLCDLATGKELQRLKGLRCELHELGFSADGRFLLAAVDNPGPNADDYWRVPVVRVWQRTSRNTLKKRAEIPCSSPAFVRAPDGRWVGVPSRPGWSFYDLLTGKWSRSCPWLPGVVLAVSPSGRVLVCVSEREQTESLVERASGRTICKLACHPDSLHGGRFAFSPDGAIVAGDLNSATVVLWDACTGKQIGALAGHRGDICSLCFSPDGRYLVTGSSDTTVLIWDYRKSLTGAARR